MEPTDTPSRTASAPRVVGWLALAGVSLIAGIASYFHALAVVQAAGATAPVSYLVPALADLVILGASADLLAASRGNQPRPALTMLTLAVGVGVTLAMNIAAGGHHGLGGRLVSGWPALAFTLALESLAGLVRRGRDGAPRSPVPAASPQPATAAAPTRDEAFLVFAETGTRKEIGDFLSLVAEPGSAAGRSRAQGSSGRAGRGRPGTGGRALRRGAAAAARGPLAIVSRDLLADLAAVLRSPDRILVRDAVGLLRELAPSWGRYRQMTATSLRGDLLELGVRTVNTSGTHFLDPADLRAAVARREACE